MLKTLFLTTVMEFDAERRTSTSFLLEERQGDTQSTSAQTEDDNTNADNFLQVPKIVVNSTPKRKIGTHQAFADVNELKRVNNDIFTNKGLDFI